MKTSFHASLLYSLGELRTNSPNVWDEPESRAAALIDRLRVHQPPSKRARGNITLGAIKVYSMLDDLSSGPYALVDLTRPFL
jgi:hypothetical protein